jgi:hypothetical protein
MLTSESIAKLSLTAARQYFLRQHEKTFTDAAARKEAGATELPTYSNTR